jgi:hypothetical protein
MHHAMANKALSIVSAEATTDAEFWHPAKTRLRELVMSGAVDYKSNVERTPEDREIVLRYLDA